MTRDWTRDVPRTLKDKSRKVGNPHKLNFCSGKGEFTVDLEFLNISVRGTLEMTLSCK